jgi:hypothetical protein
VERELHRLILREGFSLFAGSWETEIGQFSRENLPSVIKLRRLLDAAPKNHWAGFQLFYPMTEEEVRSATGVDLVESMLAVFGEVTPLMNLTMQVQLKEAGDEG